MNSVEINAVKEFRRFVNTYIYPGTIGNIVENIVRECNTDSIHYQATPQATIKFHSNTVIDNLSSYTHFVHNVLNCIFVEYFADPFITSLIRNKIHTEIQDEELKNILRKTLQEIQCGNPCYLGLLFNITILNDNNTYLYL